MKLSIIFAGLCMAFVSKEATAQSNASQFAVETVAQNDNSTIVPESKEILIYPNPATNSVSLTWENKVEMIEVSDSKGQILNRFFVDTMKELRINLSQYSNGVYFIHITHDTGISVRSIVKE